jgi:hypothetical protein
MRYFNKKRSVWLLWSSVVLIAALGTFSLSRLALANCYSVGNYPCTVDASYCECVYTGLQNCLANGGFYVIPRGGVPGQVADSGPYLNYPELVDINSEDDCWTLVYCKQSDDPGPHCPPELDIYCVPDYGNTQSEAGDDYYEDPSGPACPT